MAKRASSETSEAPKKTTRARKTTAKKQDNVSLSELLSEIEQRSYEIFEERIQQGISGDALSDWLLAEKEIKEKHNIKE